ncbi:hypothetical protein I5504_01340 [Citrobacter koseri]|nr:MULTISPECIES: hypothetical protein [Enterobacteriaceae]EKT5041884.1 hypothetical protein [Enterobacter hormaechei]MDE5191753.1 hypothetical protein [Citrobacter freundii]EID6992276.1 hypothetical protein [Escherichia coli]EIT8651673.1 hypothetical protein [Escherichia coli]MBJ9304730.1 hypothetical protein [Citrobacter koseri]
MEYTFNIFEKTDEKNCNHYFVFDSFNTCLGYFNNIDLAYGLINIYLKYLEEIYKDSPHFELEKQIVQVSDEIKKQNNKELDDLVCIEEIITSLFYIEKNKEKEFLFTEKSKLFSTIPTLLNKNFTVVFDSEDIKRLHKQFLSTLIKRKYAKGSTVETLKNALSDKFEEKELANYFPFLIQENEVDDESIKFIKPSKLSS